MRRGPLDDACSAPWPPESRRLSECMRHCRELLLRRDDREEALTTLALSVALLVCVPPDGAGVRGASPRPSRPSDRVRTVYDREVLRYGAGGVTGAAARSTPGNSFPSAAIVDAVSCSYGVSAWADPPPWWDAYNIVHTKSSLCRAYCNDHGALAAAVKWRRVRRNGRKSSEESVSKR